MSFIFTWHLAKALMIEKVIYNKTSYLENPKKNKQNAIHKKKKKKEQPTHHINKLRNEVKLSLFGEQ